ncbi:mucin-5AC isoform X1 [Micropterus salmoides]|uniref:mucin-5AC isoform X1 n=1 Tax=Micropterus salmoides TaxID=27706 RepID=UPI0018EA4145|nr:mucin-5AC isoform X1 [Micropterus salmoides]
MSADDFQSKYASVMESMLRSAVAETTKLFETMVDELKAEISKMKEENEDLKTRCSQFEGSRSQQTFNTESEVLPGRSLGSEKRDTAVQCDLVPVRMMLVEQCQQLRHSSLQNQEQRCGYQEYALQGHNNDTYGEENSQMAFILVKQESVLKEEEVESAVVCGQVLSDKADSPQASVCGPLPQKVEETEVALKSPCLGMDSGLQGAQSQSSELEHSLVISLAAIKDDIEEESEVGLKISEIGTQGELIPSEKHPLMVAQYKSEAEPLEKEQPLVVPQQYQREDEVNEKNDVTLQQCAVVESTEEQLAQSTPLNKGEAWDKLKNDVAEVEVSSQPDLPVRRKRGRPPKKAKQQSVKKILQSPSSYIATEQEVKNPPTTTVEEIEVGTLNITSSEPPEASPVQPKEASSIITSSVREKANTAVKDIEHNKVDTLAVSVASFSRRCSSEKKKTSKSPQPSTEIKKGDLQAPSTKVSSIVETLNTSSAEFVHPRERRTSVTLQDAMLLVEAMNQSTVENTFSVPQRMAAPPQTQCSPSVGTLQIMNEVPAKQKTPASPVGTPGAASNLPITELSTTQSTIKKRSAAPQTTDATPTNAALAHINVVLSKQHMVTVSNTTTSIMPSSTSATQTSVQSQLGSPLPLLTSVSTSQLTNTMPHKIIVVSRSVPSLMPHKIVAQPPARLPAVSTAVATQNSRILSGSKAAAVPLGKPSFSSVPQNTIYITTSKPLSSSPSTSTSTNPQSGTLPPPKITIIIPRQVSVVAPTNCQSQTTVPTSKQESAKSSAPVKVSSSQLVSSSQELSVSVDTQPASDEVVTILSQRKVDASDNLDSPKQTASASETINVPTETCSTLKSAGLVPTSKTPAVPPTLEQSAVVRLTRLPFPISTEESVLVSKLHTNGSSTTQSILNEGTTHAKPSSVVISTQPSETLVLSTDICPSLKESPVIVSVKTSQMSEEPNDIQEKASLPSENCTTLEESPNSKNVQPSTSSEVSAPAINVTEPSAISGTAGEPTSDLDEELISPAVQDCALPNDPAIEEKQSSAIIHLTSVTPKDSAHPRLQMTKAQFLAQLAVSPVVQDPKKATSNDSVSARGSCAETSTSDKERLQKMSRLRSYLKPHLQARRSETNLASRAETNPAASQKKPRLENHSPNDKNTTSEPITVSPEMPGAVEDVTSLKKTTNDPTSISPRRSGLCKDVVNPKKIVGEPTCVSSRRSNANSESTPESPRISGSSRDGIGSKNTKSTSVSPRRTGTDGVGSKNKKSTSVSPRRTGTDGVASKNKKSTSVNPRRSSAIKNSVSPKMTKNTSVHPGRTSSTRNGASPKNTKTGGSPNNTKTTSVRPKRTSSSTDGASRDAASPEKTQSSFNKNGTSPKMSTNESTSFCRRSCTLPKDGSSSTQIKRESNSFSPRRFSITTDGVGTKNTKCESSSPTVRWPKLAKDGVSPRNTGESTPAKKPRLNQGGTGLRKNLREVNAKKLAKAAKAKKIAKIKKSNQSKLLNGAKTSQLVENRASCEAVKKCTAVWTPPRLPSSRTPPTGGKRSSLLTVKKETRSPRSPRSRNNTVVYPPSVSLHPIPLRGPPIVSPLQPLSVIGRRLLKNQCGECGRVLSSSAALESHVSLHTGRRPFSCKLCGKRFSDSKGLKRHGRVHRNGRIHICQQCGKGFVYSFGLTKHLQMVHSRIKPFVCQICNKGFFTKRDVEAHIRIHTGEKPFHCNLCEKKFARRVELNMHLRWHNGEKRHWCPYCGKGFLDFNNLKRHKYIHTGEKPHSCPHCPKNFTQSGHLKKHVKNVHKVQ